MEPDYLRRTGAAPTRRGFVVAGTVLAGAVAATASGCSLNNPFDSTPTPATEAVRDLAPDVAVAVEAVTAIRATQQLVEAIAVAHPTLSRRTAPLATMHDAHLAALVNAVPDRVDTTSTDAPRPVAQREPRAALQLTTYERTLHDQLTALALRAESGPFARLLGSMAASVSQHLAAGTG